ncbi:MAG: hypothetical protein II952_06465, partial [Paludibacteraceae bacterium]|nr:hypothetical protein [Paludibacteraceae bacterium]
PFSTSVFKTDALDHSAIVPSRSANVSQKTEPLHRNWRSMTALLRNLYNCLNSSSPHRKQPAAWFTLGTH